MPTITQTHTFDASPSTLFAHLTETEKLDTWWTTSSQSDPRPGGAFEFRFDMTDEAKAAGKPDHAERGTYTTFEPGKALAFPWDSAAPTSVRMTFEGDDQQTTLHLEHLDLPDEMVEPIGGGWQFFLGNLKSVLAGGPDQRTEFGLAVPA